MSSCPPSPPSPTPPPPPPPFFIGRDVIAQAQSGTGKTATFAVSILQQLEVSKKDCQALVLAPTRELAQQIQKVPQNALPVFVHMFCSCTESVGVVYKNCQCVCVCVCVCARPSFVNVGCQAVRYVIVFVKRYPHPDRPHLSREVG